MLVSLDAPYVDTSAADLSLALGGPELPALYVLDLALPGGRRLRLRLLGASHQVLLHAPAPTGRPGLHAPAPTGRPALDTGSVPAGAPDLAGVPGAVVLAETVACLPGRRPDLPEQVRDPASGYTFTASVLRPDAGGLGREVAALRSELADDPYALVGVFPGDPDAVTALAVAQAAGTVRWRTWHAYPQTNELVLTETVVTR